MAKKKRKLFWGYKPAMLCYAHYYEGDPVPKVGWGNTPKEAREDYLKKNPDYNPLES